MSFLTLTPYSNHSKMFILHGISYLRCLRSMHHASLLSDESFFLMHFYLSEYLGFGYLWNISTVKISYFLNHIICMGNIQHACLLLRVLPHNHASSKQAHRVLEVAFQLLNSESRFPMIRQLWSAIIPCLKSAEIYLYCNTVYSAGWSILKILT